MAGDLTHSPIDPNKLLEVMFQRNRIELTGNITKPPKTATAGDTSVTRARLIHNETVQRSNGETYERLTAVEIQIWGKLGEAFAEHVTSKKPVFIEGSLQLAEWEKDGERLFHHYIRVNHWQFLLPKAHTEAADQAA